MTPKEWKLAGAGLASCLLPLLSGCAFDAPKDSGAVKIIIDDPSTAPKSVALAMLENLTTSAAGGGGGGSGSSPTTTSDFNCFAVNVTGPGIVPQGGNIQDCKSTNDMHGAGVGIITNSAPRGSPISISVPAGADRTIDVYGVYPPDANCGGAGSGSNDGYFLGRVKQALSKDTTVTIPISYVSNTSPDVTCTPKSSNGGLPPPPVVQVFGVFPGGGRPAGGYTVRIRGSGFLSRTVAKIGGLPCITQNFVASTDIDCTVPSALAGGATYPITVDNLDGDTFTTPSNIFSVASSGSTPFITIDNSMNGINFGSIPYNGSQDLTITFANAGGVNALVGSPTTLSGPFSYKGGSWPGTGGTCTSSIPSGSLATDTTCTIVLTFAPGGSTGPLSQTGITWWGLGPIVVQGIGI